MNRVFAAAGTGLVRMGRRGLPLVAAACLLALSACGGASSSTSSGATAASEERVAIDVLWRVRVGEPSPFSLRRRELGGVALSPQQDVVVATTARGSILALDTVDGSPRWRVEFGSAIDVAPTIDGSEVLVSLPDGTLRALDLASGRERLRYRANTVFVSPPAVGGGLVAALASDGRVHAVDRETGRAAWTVERPTATDLSLHGAGRPWIDRDGVFTGFVDGSFARIGLDGRVLWTVDLSHGHRRMADADAAPVRVGDRVYGASFAGGVHALSVEDGAVIWHNEITGASDLMFNGESIVFADGAGHLVHLDARTGEERFRVPLDRVAAGSPVRAEQVLLVPTRQSGVLLTASADAWIHARFEPDFGFTTAPAVGDGVFFAISDGGWIYAVRFARYRPTPIHVPHG